MDFLLPNWLIHTIIIIALLIASYTDIKKREVPDLLSYLLIGLGITAGIVSSIFLASIWPLLTALCGLAVGYLVGAVMFYAGQWGGGDAKILMGIGALQGFSIELIIDGLIPPLASTILTIFIMGAVYGLAYILFLVIKKWKPFKKAFIKKIREKQFLRTRKITIVVVVAAIILFLVLQSMAAKTIVITIALLIYIMQYGYAISKALEEVAMIKDVAVNTITEGEWIVKDVVVKGKRICGPKDLGISQKQIDELKKHKIKKITIKEGIPFIPAFLLGYIMIIIVGHWLQYLF